MNLTITHLIHTTYQVVDMNDNDTVLFQGDKHECETYMRAAKIVADIDEKWTLPDLHARLDKLEQELQWTREAIEILIEEVSDINSSEL
jgi:hypothetical protein